MGRLKIVYPIRCGMVVISHPKFVKAIKGKKSDKRDAQWIADLFRAYPEISRAPIVPQIFRQTRRFFAGGLSPGKENQRRMAENMRCEWCAANFGTSS